MKISIPNPCHENWDEMTPGNLGRFCSSCQKNVIDFSAWPAEDITRYFIKHNGERICGRFRNEQLQSIVIQIPQQHLTFVQPGKYFLWALFLAFGTTLFSCTDQNGNKRKIDKVEIVDTVKQVQAPTIGMPIPTEQSDIKPLHSYNKPEIVIPDTAQLVETNEVIMTKGVILTGEVELHNQDEIYEFADEMPVFPGGQDSLQKFIRQNLIYPKTDADVHGKVFVEFVVKRDSTINDIKIRRSLQPDFDAEAVRLVKTMPKWIPGKYNGEAVNTKVIIPIKF